MIDYYLYSTSRFHILVEFPLQFSKQQNTSRQSTDFWLVDIDFSVLSRSRSCNDRACQSKISHRSGPVLCLEGSFLAKLQNNVCDSAFLELIGRLLNASEVEI